MGKRNYWLKCAKREQFYSIPHHAKRCLPRRNPHFLLPIQRADRPHDEAADGLFRLDVEDGAHLEGLDLHAVDRRRRQPLFCFVQKIVCGASNFAKIHQQFWAAFRI